MKKSTLTAAFAALIIGLPAWGQGTTVVAPTVPTNTANLAIKNIDMALYRMTIEMTRMVSSRAAAISPDDKERIDSLFDWVNNTIQTSTATISDWHFLVSTPLTDFTAVIAPVENPALMNAINQLLGCDVNMRISASSRINDGMLAQDKQDLVDGIAKAQSYINSFYTEDNPLGLMQVMPRIPVVEPMQLP
jgi:hypothetical protein